MSEGLDKRLAINEIAETAYAVYIIRKSID